MVTDLVIAEDCLIVEPRLPVNPSVSIFKTLTVSSGTSGLQLRGSAVMFADSTIALVHTRIVLCGAAVATNACAPPSPSAITLTSAALSPAIPATAGQQILVTVTITEGTATPAPAASQDLWPPE
ncbi:MAG TPA: hypothetical protein VGD07_15430 [Methylomirabilota bacterium]